MPQFLDPLDDPDWDYEDFDVAVEEDGLPLTLEGVVDDEPVEGPWDNQDDQHRPDDEATVGRAPQLPLKREAPVDSSVPVKRFRVLKKTDCGLPPPTFADEVVQPDTQRPAWHDFSRDDLHTVMDKLRYFYTMNGFKKKFQRQIHMVMSLEKKLGFQAWKLGATWIYSGGGNSKKGIPVPKTNDGRSLAIRSPKCPKNQFLHEKCSTVGSFISGFAI